MEIELFLHVWLEGMPHTILPNETVLVRSASSGTVVLTEQTMGDLGAKSALCCLCSQANPPIDREGKLPLSDVVFHCGGCSRGLILIYNLRHVPAKNPWDILLAGLSWIIQILYILRFMCHPRNNKYSALWSYCFVRKESVLWTDPKLYVRNLSRWTEASWTLRTQAVDRVLPSLFLSAHWRASNGQGTHWLEGVKLERWPSQSTQVSDWVSLLKWIGKLLYTCYFSVAKSCPILLRRHGL